MGYTYRLNIIEEISPNLRKKASSNKKVKTLSLILAAGITPQILCLQGSSSKQMELLLPDCQMELLLPDCQMELLISDCHSPSQRRESSLLVFNSITEGFLIIV